MVPEDRRERELLAAAILEKKIREARRDPNAFCEYVFLDDEGKPIRQQWFHREWQDLLSSHERLVVFSSVDHGKSVQTSIMRPLYELGRRPGSRGCIISDTASQSAKFLSAIKANIESNDRLHEVFPDLRRENFRSWREDAILFEADTPTTEKDFTIQAVGVGGAIMGARFNWIILDDVLNLENTWTEEQCQKVVEWYQTTVLPRALKGCRIWVVGTAWSPHDLMHWLDERGDYKVVRYPAAMEASEREARTGERWTGETFHDLVPIWPDRWPAERLLRRERSLTPFRFRQLHMCSAVDEASTPFPSETFQKMRLRGVGVPYAPDDWSGPAFCGVDLGAGKTRRSALTVFFSIGLTPDGDRCVLEIKSGRYHASQIESILAYFAEKYDPIFMVENNAVQQLVIEFLQTGIKVPIHPFTTGRQKSHPEYGIESLAVEMAGGSWIVPNVNGIVHPEVQSWFNELAAYTPQSHTGDRVMASYFAREALRRFERRGRTIQARLIGGDKRRR